MCRPGNPGKATKATLMKLRHFLRWCCVQHMGVTFPPTPASNIHLLDVFFHLGLVTQFVRLNARSGNWRALYQLANAFKHLIVWVGSTAPVGARASILRKDVLREYHRWWDNIGTQAIGRSNSRLYCLERERVKTIPDRLNLNKCLAVYELAIKKGMKALPRLVPARPGDGGWQEAARAVQLAIMFGLTFGEAVFRPSGQSAPHQVHMQLIPCLLSCTLHRSAHGMPIVKDQDEIRPKKSHSLPS